MIRATKVVDQNVSQFIDLDDINKMLRITILPEHFTGNIFVTVVCREANDFEWEAYYSENVLYCVLPLDYDTVRGLGFEDVTVLVKDELRRYAYQTRQIFEKVEAA